MKPMRDAKCEMGGEKLKSRRKTRVIWMEMALEVRTMARKISIVWTQQISSKWTQLVNKDGSFSKGARLPTLVFAEGATADLFLTFGELQASNSASV